MSDLNALGLAVAVSIVLATCLMLIAEFVKNWREDE